jgi:hypothetical protein
MKRNFYETLEETESALPSDRSTGLVLAAAAAAAALIWRHQPLVVAFGLVLGAALALTSIIAPERLHRLNYAWMSLGRLMGKVMSPVVMLVLFCIAIVPFGLAMQLKRDPLRRRQSAADQTYWTAPDATPGPNGMTHQF